MDGSVEASDDANSIGSAHWDVDVLSESIRMIYGKAHQPYSSCHWVHCESFPVSFVFLFGVEDRFIYKMRKSETHSELFDLRVT